MAAADLYPPLMLNTYQQSFIYNKNCRIIFSLSSFNDISKINTDATQVSMLVQNSNKSVFNNRAGIYLCPMYKYSSDENDLRYYIDIPQKFSANTYYKVQVRFTGVDASPFPTKDNKPDYGSALAWVDSNLDYFSEWSQITLVKAISKPILSVKINGEQAYNGQTVSTTSQTVEVMAELKNENGSPYTDEFIEYYTFSIQGNGIGDNDTYTSEKIYLDGLSASAVTYKFPIRIGNVDIESEDALNYMVSVYGVTQSGFPISLKRLWVKYNRTVEGDSPELAVSYHPEEGQIRLDIDSICGRDAETQAPLPASGIVKIYRTDMTSHFKKWEEIAIVQIDYIKSLYWIDSTVKSGVWYKYGVDYTNTEGVSTPMTTTEPVKAELEYAYLVADNTQLKLRFNTQVGGYRRKINESTVETIGNKFPFVFRNGHINYRTFSLNGTIARNMDDWNTFSTKKELYKYDDIIELNELYNEAYDIPEEYDYTLERDFREAVMDFLYGDHVFLFRSPTEGNILIRLTDISFSPNNTLSRMIYDFSATAVEVEDETINNNDYYDVQTIDWDFAASLVWSTYDFFLTKDLFYENDSVEGNNMPMVYEGDTPWDTDAAVDEEAGLVEAVPDADPAGYAPYNMALIREYILLDNKKNVGSKDGIKPPTSAYDLCKIAQICGQNQEEDIHKSPITPQELEQYEHPPIVDSYPSRPVETVGYTGFINFLNLN